jgi:hypothetical protein
MQNTQKRQPLAAFLTNCVDCVAARALGGFAQRAEFLIELFHAPGGVNNLLLAGVEGMAVGTNFHMQRLFHGGFGGEGVAARAGHLDFFVIGMDSVLHVLILGNDDRRYWPSLESR